LTKGEHDACRGASLDAQRRTKHLHPARYQCSKRRVQVSDLECKMATPNIAAAARPASATSRHVVLDKLDAARDERQDRSRISSLRHAVPTAIVQHIVQSSRGPDPKHLLIKGKGPVQVSHYETCVMHSRHIGDVVVSLGRSLCPSDVHASRAG
jgi:hypothetical protein